MRLHLLSYTSSLGLIAGTLLWPTPSSAQGFCYMVDTDGAVINLDSLCQTDAAPAPTEPQADTTGAGEVQQSPTQPVRSFTITGPASIPGSSQAPPEAAPATPQTDGVDAEVAPTAPQPTPPPSVVAPNPPQLNDPPPVVPPTPPTVVTPTTPQPNSPPSGVAPTTPQLNRPSSGVVPTTPQSNGAGAEVAPAGGAVSVDGAASDNTVANPAAETGVPAIAVPGISTSGIGAP